jgi:ubiquinone/menaquinone biosynthesis C-methylase UbiE
MGLEMLAADAYVRPNENDPIRFYNTPLLGRLYQLRVARCISLLPPGRRVLEIGYGSGVSFLNLRRKFNAIHGIDLHDQAHAVTESFAQTGLTLDLRRGSILNLPFADEFFDAALAISIHEHLEPHAQAAAFAEVRRVVRPGGCYVVGVPGLNGLMTLAFRLMGFDIRKHHFTSERDVLAAMRDRFDVDRTIYSPSVWPQRWTTYLCIRGWTR